MPSSQTEVLLDALTLEEQVLLVAGRDFWTTNPIPRLKIPAIKVSDGPNGARGGGALVGGIKAAAFPASIALSASWNVELVREIGAALAAETKAKGAHVLLAPTVNIHRSTLNGRNFECYSEDPFLTGEIAVAYVNGLQTNGIAATVKHFIGNESEYQRRTISSQIDMRTLREIYLPPFEAVVNRANVWALMTSYNRLNGAYVSEQSDLINGILKTEWGFDGLVISDWFGTNATGAAMNGGLDLEMPGPPHFRGEKLLAAVQSGEVSPEALQQSVRRLLRLIERVGGFARPELAQEREDNRPETRRLIRLAGAEGIVLLQNDGILPLAIAPNLKIAVIGPNACQAQIMGGGSAQLNPYYRVSPYDGLRAALPEDVILHHAIGCSNHRLVPQLNGDVECAYFNGTNLEGKAVHFEIKPDAFFMFMGAETPGFDPDNFSARLRTRYTASHSGDHEFSLITSGAARLMVDDEIVVDARNAGKGDEFFGTASHEIRATKFLEAGLTYKIMVEYCSTPNPDGMGLKVLRVGLALILGEAAIEKAVAIARARDVALLFVGLNGEWDGEGQDRPNLNLPRLQNELISRIAAVNPKTIVVLQSGAPLTMPWLGNVAAMMQAWYPGQEAGNAIADVLLGHAEPGGRLPQTFPKRLEDDPAFPNYPGENGVVRYGEGIYVGYRSYEKRKIEPLFPFGFGLSYTNFRLGTLRLNTTKLTAGSVLEAEIEVFNTGPRAGSTVVQFYVTDIAASVARPIKELKAFRKVHLQAGTSATLKIQLDMRAFAFFDIARNAWLAEAGDFELQAGFSSADIPEKANFSLTETWVGPLS